MPASEPNKIDEKSPLEDPKIDKPSLLPRRSVSVTRVTEEVRKIELEKSTGTKPRNRAASVTRMRVSEVAKKMKRGRSSGDEEDEVKKIEELKNMVEKLNLDMIDVKRAIDNINAELLSKDGNINNLTQRDCKIEGGEGKE